MKYVDKNNKKVSDGDIINLHQTVNGQNLFVVFKTEPLDIRYAHDLNRIYEYDKDDMLAPSRITSEVEWEIINNLDFWRECVFGPVEPARQPIAYKVKKEIFCFCPGDILNKKIGDDWTTHKITWEVPQELIEKLGSEYFKPIFEEENMSEELENDKIIFKFLGYNYQKELFADSSDAGGIYDLYIYFSKVEIKSFDDTIDSDWERDNHGKYYYNLINKNFYKSYFDSWDKIIRLMWQVKDLGLDLEIFKKPLTEISKDELLSGIIKGVKEKFSK